MTKAAFWTKAQSLVLFVTVELFEILQLQRTLSLISLRKIDSSFQISNIEKQLIYYKFYNIRKNDSF